MGTKQLLSDARSKVGFRCTAVVFHRDRRSSKEWASDGSIDVGQPLKPKSTRFIRPSNACHREEGYQIP